MQAKTLQLFSHNHPVGEPSAHGAASQGTGTVLNQAESGWIVQIDPVTRLIASRAESCLLEPRVGDKVWFVREAGSSYLLAVLERRESDRPATLSIDGDVELLARGGSLKLKAETDMGIEASKHVELKTQSFRLRAKVGHVLLDECTSLFKSLTNHFTESTRVGGALETLVDRVRTHSKSSVRSVEGLDMHRSGSLVQRAETTAHLEARHAMVNGTELVKLDGQQIHLG